MRRAFTQTQIKTIHYINKLLKDVKHLVSRCLGKLSFCMKAMIVGRAEGSPQV